MPTIEQIQNGDLIFVRDKNIMSALIQNTQGDFEWSHVCSAWKIEGRLVIFTTGAYFDWKQMAFIFGRVDAVEYLSKREWCIGRRTDLTPEMMETRLQTLLRLERNKTPYAVAKLIKLASWRFKAGVADKIHDVPEVHPVKTFCAESEALGIIEGKRAVYLDEITDRANNPSLAIDMAQGHALREVNSKYPQKLEACVHTPETLFDSPATLIRR